MISMVIPTYTINSELEEIAIQAALTYRDQVDELIITEDGGMYSEELQGIADVYIYNKKNVGFTRNVNRGWLLSTGDYTMIVNSDTQLLEGELKTLCVPGKVTSPEIASEFIPLLAGSFFVVPKEIKEKYGLLREEMKMFDSDSEYESRIKDIFQKVPEVRIYHHIHATINPAGLNTDEVRERDRQIHFKLRGGEA